MRLVDSHHHFWNPQFVEVPWLKVERASFGDPSPLRGPYLPAHYRADAGPLEVTATVHVEAACRPEDGLLETAWLTGVGDAAGMPAALVAAVDPEREDLESVLDRHARSPRLRGVRMRLNYDEASGRKMVRAADLMHGPAFRRGLKAIARRQLVFDLSIFPSQFADAARLADEVPEASLVLEHLGWPLVTDQAGFSAWSTGMKDLARRQNVTVKISGFWAIDRAWDKARIAPWAKEAMAHFGPERCMYGSNLPIEKLMCPMPRQVETLQEIFAAEPSDVLDALFRGTATRVYRLAS
ncbi:MAG: amidohydrolase [Lautropia sp.]